MAEEKPKLPVEGALSEEAKAEGLIQATEEEKGPSKRALEKARKKAEAAAKKAQYAMRPKEAPAKGSSSSEPANIFAQGWLNDVYKEKPVPVRTRFPPEPNGYLHIGHAKAITVNFGFAKHHNGICFLRYDDTNPAKEEEKYFTAIHDMVKWLGFEPYQITYSSDHFDKLYELAEELIRRDKAYVCHCTREQVNEGRGGPDNRGPRKACADRDRPVDESLTEFRAMRDGKYGPGEAHLRMKQKLTDPNEGNPQMWDLGAYRVVKDNHHYRTGDKWKIYPTYDFTHCIVDAFEDISHSLCTTEFQQSRISYDWLLEQLDMKEPGKQTKGPMQREYGRLNVAGAILSKRKIQVLVEGTTVDIKKPDGTVEKKTIPPAVRNWDDPRLLTLVAIRRRGVPAQAILNFVSELGITDALTNIQVVRFEAVIRKYLERTVPRLMLVLDPIPVTIEDLRDGYSEELTVPYDPKKPEGDSRPVPFTKTVYIDRTDFREEDDPNFFRLAPGKTVGLLNAPFAIKATSFSKDANGKVTSIKAEKAEGIKPKAFIHWVSSSGVKVVARQYNALFKSEEPNALNWKDGSYADDLNPESEVPWPNAVIEPAIELLKKGHAKHPSGASDDLVRFQAVRTGYFCIDPDTEDEKDVLNQIVTLKEDAGKGK